MLDIEKVKSLKMYHVWILTAYPHRLEMLLFL